MNIALEKTEEYVNGVKRRSYGDAFVRGNNGLWLSLVRHLFGSLIALTPLCVCSHVHLCRLMGDETNIISAPQQAQEGCSAPPAVSNMQGAAGSSRVPRSRAAVLASFRGKGGLSQGHGSSGFGLW